MKITVKITKEILRKSMWCGHWIENNLEKPIDWNGEQGVPATNCAIALAIIEIFPMSMVCTDRMIYVYDRPIKRDVVSDARYAIGLPLVASEFIEDFDRLEPEHRADLSPFSFEMDIPEELINEIGIEEATKIIERSETLELA